MMRAETRNKVTRPLLIALFVDTLGTGFFAPFAFLYYTANAGMTFSEVGLAVSAATLASIAASPALGLLIERAGYGPVMIGALLIECVGYALTLGVRDFWGLFGAVLIVQIGTRAFFPANSTLVAATYSDTQRDKIFSYIQVARNAGAGAGALLAFAAIAASETSGFGVLVIANSASFLLAAILLIPLRNGGRGEKKAAAPKALAVRSGLLRDGPFLVFTTANVGIVLALTALDIALPAYAVTALGAPAEVAGLLYAVNTITVIVVQIAVTSLVRKIRRGVVILCGTAAFGVSFAVLALNGLGALSLPLLMIVLITVVLIYTVGELLVGPAVYAVASARAPEGNQGRYLNLFHLSWSVGGVIAPLGFGWALDNAPNAMWLVLAVIVVTCGAAVWLTEKVMASQKEQEAAV
jgi:MFS family permease